MRTPNLGDVIVFDGTDHQVTGVEGDTIEFSDGGHSRGTSLQHLEELGLHRFGVVGRQDKRPHRTAVGLHITPAKES